MSRMSFIPQSKPPFFRIEPFRGINLSSTPSQIDQSESPDMLNVNIDERGALNKRTGYSRVFPESLGEGQINGLFTFYRRNGSRVHLLAHGTKLYMLILDGEQPIEIYDGLSNHEVHFFVMGDKCYIIDGVHYLVYDGLQVKEVQPYIPQLSISREPTGGGEKDEDFNLLGNGFKDSFSADGEATEFLLSLNELDETEITAIINGVEAIEGEDFTVDRQIGVVTFETAPLKGTNNVIITAYKTFEGFSDRVKKNRFSVLFGGSNDTRVFLSGHPDFPNRMIRSGLNDPTYYPENGFYNIGSDSDRIQGFSKQYDYLVIEKERSKWMMQYQLGLGEPSFPTRPINDRVGTSARRTIQLIENNPVSLGKDGIYMLVASSVRDERNVQHISEKVDARLLREPNLDQAISINFDRKYWIVINGNAYIFDYAINEWYIYDNICASQFIEIDGYLYFGSCTDGLVHYFKKADDPFPFDDDGQPVRSYWNSKLIYFERPEHLKLVERVFVGMKPNVHTSLNLYTRTNNKGETFNLTKRLDMLNFNFTDFNRFGFVVSDMTQEVAKKVKLKKITHMQIKIENNEPDEGLGILHLAIKFNVKNEVK